MKTLKTWVAAAAIVALSGAAQAALIDRSGGMIYDTTRNITWLSNMNANGLMTWNAATAWANNLVYQAAEIPPLCRCYAAHGEDNLSIRSD